MRILHSFGFAVIPSLCVSAAAMTQHTGGMPNHAGMQMAGSLGVTALLTSPLGTGSASGTATVEGTTVRVTWAGDQPGSTRPWYVHRGSCMRDQGVVGAASPYRPIAVDAGGSGTGTVALHAPLTAGEAYYVAVHTSPGDTAPAVIACGPLSDGKMSMGQADGHQMGAMPMANVHGSRSQPAAMPMDHSTMDHSSMPMSSMPMSSMADTSLMSIHMRMMADPVIRERVMTDPMLQRMMAQMPGSGMMTTGGAGAATSRPAAAAGAMSHEGMSMPGMTTPAKAAPVRKAPARAQPARRPAAAAAKPAARPAPKPATSPKDPMQGMDHSKMPGMKKP